MTVPISGIHMENRFCNINSSSCNLIHGLLLNPVNGVFALPFWRIDAEFAATAARVGRSPSHYESWPHLFAYGNPIKADDTHASRWPFHQSVVLSFKKLAVWISQYHSYPFINIRFHWLNRATSSCPKYQPLAYVEHQSCPFQRREVHC